jgi:ubiquinone/menaquinone biosynthesis C-methylase UbiE
MEANSRKEHWEKVFTEKKLTEVSWYQPNPKTSIDLIKATGLGKDARIIDIGAGDSMLIDLLLEEGYTNIYALDISHHALERAKKRLGSKADQVHWVVSDITEFESNVQFDFWHDRAAFHFLTEEADIEKYLKIATKAVKGYLSIGTFSPSGPKKCSNLEIKQYSGGDLKEIFAKYFENINCFEESHTTPSGNNQDFTFCLFKKKQEQ